MNNIVIAEEGEIEEAEAKDEGMPGLVYRDDSSDDEDKDYVRSDQNDMELEAEEEYLEDRSVNAEPEPMMRTCSGCRVKERSFYHNEYQFLQLKGKWEEADAIEKYIAKAEVENSNVGTIDDDPIELMEGEETVLGCIMMQLSLKAGLKKWGSAERKAP